jgi:hypothetical protein
LRENARVFQCFPRGACSVGGPPRCNVCKLRKGFSTGGHCVTAQGNLLHARDAIANGTLARVLAYREPDQVDAHALYTSHRSISAKLLVFIDAPVAG